MASRLKTFISAYVHKCGINFCTKIAAELPSECFTADISNSKLWICLMSIKAASGNVCKGKKRLPLILASAYKLAQGHKLNEGECVCVNISPLPERFASIKRSFVQEFGANSKGRWYVNTQMVSQQAKYNAFTFH